MSDILKENYFKGFLRLVNSQKKGVRQMPVLFVQQIIRLEQPKDSCKKPPFAQRLGLSCQGEEKRRLIRDL